ncbi:MAG TPA: type II CAAX endopeptidase family protein [archaeon]|nr:type II CAAX endopeptidase family protein [archaeon]
MEFQPFYGFLLDAALLLTPLAFVKFYEKKKLSEEFGFSLKPFGKTFFAAFKIFIALFVYLFIVSIVFAAAGLNDSGSVAEFAGNLAVQPLPLLAYFLVARVFIEEFFFRAFLVPRIGIIGSSMAFGIAHSGYGSLQVVAGVTVLGVVLAVAFRQYKSLAANFFAHMAYNAVIVLLILNS